METKTYMLNRRKGIECWLLSSGEKSDRMCCSSRATAELWNQSRVVCPPHPLGLLLRLHHHLLPCPTHHPVHRPLTECRRRGRSLRREDSADGMVVRPPVDPSEAGQEQVEGSALVGVP